jgi:hypothetical protein
MAVASGAGVPTFFAGHDKRASTVDRFSTFRVEPEEFVGRIETLNLEWASCNAVNNRKEAETRYVLYVRQMEEGWKKHGLI